MLKRITPEELQDVGVIGMEDMPRLDTDEMQRKFEETAREVIIPRFNETVETLTSEDGAAAVGARMFNGDPGNVQKALDRLKEYVEEKMISAGVGDMLSDVYDPQGKKTDIFAEMVTVDVDGEAVDIEVGGDAPVSGDAVLYTAQSRSASQKQQARRNIDAVGSAELAVAKEELNNAATAAQNTANQAMGTAESAQEAAAEAREIAEQALANVVGAVTYTAQTLTVTEQAQARSNINALGADYMPPVPTAEQVGADPAGTAENTVGAHNTNTGAHNDIRLELQAINARLNAFFDSDNKTLDELSEIVAYITSNKSLIEAITISKVSVTDIIDNLTTNVAKKPLSAAQGVVLKGLIDAVSGSLSNYQTKGDYALRSELPTMVSQLSNDKGYLTEHQDISGKLDVDKLPEAVEAALEQAKANGEFNGKNGDDGISPTVTVSKNGKETTVAITDKNGTKTATINDGADGSNGSNGKDGTSITVKSVSESTADGGSNVVTFSDGTTLTVKNGSKGSAGATGTTGATGAAGVSVSSVKQTTTSSADGGSNVVTVTLSNGTASTFTVKNGSKGSTGATGAAGKTPVKGTDYWTPADQEAIVQQVIAALGTPVFGTVDENCNIDLTGELADGKTYTFAYIDEDGNRNVIGTYTKAAAPKYTNVLATSVDADGSVFNGTGYIDGYRLSSNYNTNAPHYVSAQSGYFTTGFLPYTLADCKNCVPFYVKGVDLTTIADYCRMAMYSDITANYNSAHTANLNLTTNTGFTITKLGDLYYKITPNSGLYTTGGTSNDTGWNTKNATVAKLSLPGSGAGVIITINEPIE